jgi:hypothetical protein
MDISGGHSWKNRGKMMNNDTATKANDDFISFLEHKLEEIEKRLQRT